MRRFWAAGGTGIARGMLWYVVAIAALATLSPFDFQAVPGRHFAWLLLPDDALLNLLLLFPVGFLFAIGAPAPRIWPALVLGLGLSASLESAQLMLPSRHANVVDVLTNTFGCALGAFVQQRAARWVAGFAADELVMELPLTGALYVLAPLLMLVGLSSGDSPRVWLLLPLALLSAMILAVLYQQRFARSGQLSPHLFALRIALGFGLLALPAVLQRPVELTVIAASMALAVALAIRMRVGWAPDQRRFEASTVRRGLPWFAIYLAGAITYAWIEQGGGSAHAASSQHEALRLLEAVASLTLYGYLLSELRSRTPSGVRGLIAQVGASGVLVGCMVELASVPLDSPAAAGLRITALGASAAAGAALHRAQVGLVQALRAGGRSGPPSRAPAPEVRDNGLGCRAQSVHNRTDTGAEGHP